MAKTMLCIFLLAVIILSISSFASSSNIMYAIDSNQKNYSGIGAVSPGESIMIECPHKFQIKWSRLPYTEKDTETLTSKDRINIEGDKLKINSIDFKDAGLYYCEKDAVAYRFYLNVFAITKTVNATVPITTAENEINRLFFNQSRMNERGSANVSCFCDSGTNHSNVIISWKGGAYEKLSSMYTINVTRSDTGTNSTLILKKTSKNRELYGEYTCSCDTVSGTMKERKVYMEVPPIFEEYETSVRVTEGENIVLTCNVWGYPDINNKSIYWSFQNDNQLREGITVKVNVSNPGASELHLTKITNADRGVYMCHATNAAGSNLATYMLRVKGRYAALWPFIGILIQLVILVAIIVVYEWKKSHKSKEDTLKLNVDSNNEADAVGTERGNEPESVRQRLVKA